MRDAWDNTKITGGTVTFQQKEKRSSETEVPMGMAMLLHANGAIVLASRSNARPYCGRSSNCDLIDALLN